MISYYRHSNRQERKAPDLLEYSELAQNVIGVRFQATHITSMKKQSKLIDLVSVGPAFLRIFDDLGITEVEHLTDKDAHELFEQLQKIKGQKFDPCVEDVFRAAIEQAKDPHLSDEKRIWHYWSRVRKSSFGRAEPS